MNRRGRGEDGAASISLCEALDRVLNKGVVIQGDVTISVAEVDLVYLGLNLLLASTEAVRDRLPLPGPGLTEEAP
jgi:hypothetical protein